MKIVTDRRIPGLEDMLAQMAPEAVTVAAEGTDITSEMVRDADALVVRTRTRCDSRLLEGSRVKMVGTATIGTDHIDTQWCEANGIKVVSAPGCNAPAVMQYVASSLAAVGFDPSRHTLGIVGKGHIGSLVTDLYRQAGAKVLVCDPPRKDAGLTDEDYMPLERLLKEAHAVTFHVPYTLTGPYLTHHLLKGELPENIEFIVNASRGGVIDHRLLLEKNSERKFIIDTWPFEENPAEWNNREISRLIRSALIATPHIAGYSIEGKQRATKMMLSALAQEGFISCFVPPQSEETAVPPLERVVASFNPLPLSESLKANPESFEALRSSHLRPEAR